jgi:hypothetical protein
MEQLFNQYRQDFLSKLSPEEKKWLEESEESIREYGNTPDGIETVKDSMSEAPESIERYGELWDSLYEYLNDYYFFLYQ